MFGKFQNRILVIVTLAVVLTLEPATSGSTLAVVNVKSMTTLLTEGVSGTYAAKYSAQGDARTALASVVIGTDQVSKNGQSAWLGGSGTWAYTMTSPTKTYRWIGNGRSRIDCEEDASSPPRCFGPALNTDIGGIGGTVATNPFITGTAVDLVLTAIREGEKLSEVMTVSGFCIAGSRSLPRICFANDGKLLSISSPTPFLSGYPWTRVVLISQAHSVNAAMFQPFAKPTLPFEIFP